MIKFNNKNVDPDTIQIDGINFSDAPDFVDAYISYAEYSDGIELSDDELDKFTEENYDLVYQKVQDHIY